MSTSSEGHTVRQIRHPFSLRELFCLVTLACLDVGLAFGPAWEESERLLLGLTTGGALLGILISRLRGRTSWPLGAIGGAMGAAIATGLHLQAMAGWFPNGLTAEQQWTLAWIVAGEASVGAPITMLAIGCYIASNWITSFEKGGFVAILRRRPVRVLMVVAGVTSATVLFLNLDRLTSPDSIRPRQIVTLSDRGHRFFMGMGDFCYAALSRDGKLLAVSLSCVSTDFDDNFSGILTFRLQPTTERWLQLDNANGSAHSPAFNCHDDQLAYITSESDVDLQNPTQFPKFMTGQLHIVAANGRETASHEFPKSTIPQGFNTQLLRWLPSGEIVLEDWRGHCFFHPQTGKFTRADGETHSEPRLGTEVHLDYPIRIVESQTRRVLAEFDRFDAWEDCIGGTADGAYVISENVLYDVKQASHQEWPGVRFWTFTRRGQAVLSWAPERTGWLKSIPFADRWEASRFHCWIMLLDPRTNRILARMALSNSQVLSIAISYDGSTLAAVTDEGVYIYDVPPEFR